MVNVNFPKLVKFLVNNNISVEKAVDMVTSVYWDDLVTLEIELKQYEIFQFNCKYETFGEMMFQEWSKRHYN